MALLGPAARRAASNAIDHLGLRRPVFRLREWLIARRGSDPKETVEGLALPSAYLRTLVVGTPDLAWFLRSGEQDAAEFDALLKRNGSSLFHPGDVLEWGCGCGRLSRQVAPAVSRFTGVDINPRLISWCAGHLPGRYVRTGLAPPLAFADHSYDVIYGCSVLTHLREGSVRSWLAELARLMRPDARLLLTFHDPLHPGAAPVREALERDGWAVRFDRLEGSNNLAAYVTPDHLERLAAPALRLLDYTPSDRSTSHQAVAVFAKG